MSRGVTVTMWRLACLAFLAMCPAIGAGAEAERVYHIALRDDGAEGTGTQEDPFDGSRVDRIAAAIGRIPEGRLRVKAHLTNSRNPASRHAHFLAY